MRWDENDINYLIDKYSTNTSLDEMSNYLNKSKKSITHKASRLSLSRPNIPNNKPKGKNHRNKYDKKYYLKNKKLIYEKKRKRLFSVKKELISILGGKCNSCGYNKCIAALEFHHFQNNKEGNITHLIKDFSKQKALKEARKCILLCANCHRELHYKGT